MRKLPLFGVVAIALLLAGCKSDEEKAISSMIDKMNEQVAVLKTIKDPASAKAAAPKLQAIAADMKKLSDSADKLKPTPEEQKKLEEKYKKEMTATAEALMKEMGRIMKDPKLNTPELQAALSGMK